jgi:hypothetical protein
MAVNASQRHCGMAAPPRARRALADKPVRRPQRPRVHDDQLALDVGRRVVDRDADRPRDLPAPENQPLRARWPPRAPTQTLHTVPGAPTQTRDALCRNIEADGTPREGRARSAPSRAAAPSGPCAGAAAGWPAACRRRAAPGTTLRRYNSITLACGYRDC